MKQGIPLAPVMEIGYVIRDALKWEVNPRENSIKVRCCVLSRAAGEGLGRGGVCVQVGLQLINGESSGILSVIRN